MTVIVLITIIITTVIMIINTCLCHHPHCGVISANCDVEEWE